MTNTSQKQLVTAASVRDAELNGALSDGLIVIARLIAEEPKLAAFLRNASVDLEEKRNALKTAAPNVVDQAINTVSILLQSDQFEALDAIVARIRAKRFEREDKCAAIIESAIPLTETQRQQVKMTLKNLTGKEPVLDLAVHPELIGGLRITIGDMQYDSSIKGRLTQLKQRIQALC